MKRITPLIADHWQEAVLNFRAAGKVVALTGAGISVESGIDDFRSPGGLWSRFPPDEYATLEVFRRHPEKSWRLFRELGRGLVGKKPNKAHEVLAELERKGYLHGIVTQNVDNLHQLGGSATVLEIHGNHHYLQCLGCGDITQVPEALLQEDYLPRCRLCNEVVKPDVVLFGENVRSFEEIEEMLYRCDLLMVIGTSAQVYPAASLPEQVKLSGGLIYEFNIDETALTANQSCLCGCDYFFQGGASLMLGRFLERIQDFE